MNRTTLFFSYEHYMCFKFYNLKCQNDQWIAIRQICNICWYFIMNQVWKLYEEGKLLEIVDPKINTHNHEKDIIHVINIGLLCVQSTASKRPSMVRILAMLQGDEMEMEVIIKETPLKTLECESLLTTINSSSMSESMLKHAKKVVLQS